MISCADYLIDFNPECENTCYNLPVDEIPVKIPVLKASPFSLLKKNKIVLFCI